VLVLSDGAKLKNATLSPRDSELGKQVELGMKQIAQITGVHPHFLFDDSEGKYNANPEQAADDIVKWTFRPLVEEIEDELSMKLLAEAEQDSGTEIHLDTDCLVRGDRETQSNIVTEQVAAGIRSRNEARREIGLPPSTDPNADVLKISGDTAAQKPVADPGAAANKN
jgi:HK97 family phage portal protein